MLTFKRYRKTHQNYWVKIDSGTLNDYLRNHVMHSKNFVEVENYNEESEIYSFPSFEKFRKSILVLNETLSKIR